MIIENIESNVKGFHHTKVKIDVAVQEVSFFRVVKSMFK